MQEQTIWVTGAAFPSTAKQQVNLQREKGVVVEESLRNEKEPKKKS